MADHSNIKPSVFKSAGECKQQCCQFVTFHNWVKFCCYNGIKLTSFIGSHVSVSHGVGRLDVCSGKYETKDT